MRSSLKGGRCGRRGRGMASGRNVALRLASKIPDMGRTGAWPGLTWNGKPARLWASRQDSPSKVGRLHVMVSFHLATMFSHRNFVSDKDFIFTSSFCSDRPISLLDSCIALSGSLRFLRSSLHVTVCACALGSRYSHVPGVCVYKLEMWGCLFFSKRFRQFSPFPDSPWPPLTLFYFQRHSPDIQHILYRFIGGLGSFLLSKMKFSPWFAFYTYLIETETFTFLVWILISCQPNFFCS